MIMVKEENVIIEFTPKELFLMGELSLIWRSFLMGGLPNKTAYTHLLALELDGSMTSMLYKLRQATVAGMDGNRNL